MDTDLKIFEKQTTDCQKNKGTLQAVHIETNDEAVTYDNSPELGKGPVQEREKKQSSKWWWLLCIFILVVILISLSAPIILEKVKSSTNPGITSHGPLYLWL